MGDPELSRVEGTDGAYLVPLHPESATTIRI